MGPACRRTTRLGRPATAVLVLPLARLLVELKGFEPLTSCLQGRRSKPTELQPLAGGRQGRLGKKQRELSKEHRS